MSQAPFEPGLTPMFRLTSATNPESGTITYTYDANGNVHTRSQGGKTVTYGYNLLDQVTSKTYSDSTPGATYTYDHGRRVSASSAGVTQQSTAFDGLSRVTASTQAMDGVTHTFGYGYNLADGLKTLTLPSGRVISTAFDSSSGRPLSVSGSYNGQNTSYASNVTYAPHGAVSSLGMGNGLAEITSYNSRLRPSQITAGSLLTLGYGYSSNHDNGSVRSQTITVSGGGAYTQSYTYDLVDRLATASETKDGSTTWSETFGYDNVGNRWVSATSPSGIETGLAPTASTAFNSSNQITSSGGTYSGGNQTAFGGFQFDYDAENRQTESRMTNGAIILNTTDYVYDADGRRVKKTVVGGAATAYVYDAFGNLAAEYGTVANGDAGVRYLTVDALGSTRMVTDGNGARIECHDYLPFGMELAQSVGSRPACYTTDGVQLKFTAKERDGLGENNGLDYFLARYYSAAQGRFTSPDEFQGGIVDPFTGQQVSQPGPLPYADITDPQTLNKYAYVRNNPLRYTDPDGHVIDTLADIGFIAYDLCTLAKEGATTTNVLALGADVAGAFIPFATGGGAAVRAARAAERGVEGARLAREGLALGREITGIEGRIARQMKHLDAEHIGAAARELKGEVVKINPRDGKPFDHVTKVREAAQGLQNQAGKIKSLLGSGDLTKKARATLENNLRQANKKLEELKKAGVL